MIDAANARLCYGGLQRAFWVGFGSLLGAMALSLVNPVSSFSVAALPSWFTPFVSWFSEALILLFTFCMCLTIYFIARTASYLERSFWLWLLGSMIFGPIGMLIAYFRLKTIMAKRGI